MAKKYAIICIIAAIAAVVGGALWLFNSQASAVLDVNAPSKAPTMIDVSVSDTQTGELKTFPTDFSRYSTDFTNDGTALRKLNQASYKATE